MLLCRPAFLYLGGEKLGRGHKIPCLSLFALLRFILMRTLKLLCET